MKVTQIGSPIGRKADQRETLKGLGLEQDATAPRPEDTPAVRGMINKVAIWCGSRGMALKPRSSASAQKVSRR